MANGYSVLNDGTVVIIKWQGYSSYEEALVFDKRWRADTSIRPGAVILTDARFGAFDTTPQQAIELWELTIKSNHEKGISKHALLVSDVEFPKAKLFEKEILSKGQNIIVFSNITVACKWLGVDYGTVVKCLDEMELKSDG